MSHLKANLMPKRAQDEIGGKGVGGMREAPEAPQEANLRKLSLAFGRNPTQLAGSRPAAGFKPAERGPGGGLTATYCTPLEEPEKGDPSHTKWLFCG